MLRFCEKLRVRGLEIAGVKLTEKGERLSLTLQEKGRKHGNS